MTSTSKIVKNSVRKPPAAGKGRPKGAKNKTTANIKAAIEQAFDKAGGVDYLVKLAATDPRTFCALVGKVIPTQVTGDADNPVSIKVTLGGND
ncbi:hypothetical protein AB1P65_09460 [Roseibium alexandrii]